MITDRDFLRAERDYLTPPTELPTRCAHCREVVEDDDAIECSARAAEMLSCDDGDLICPTCSQCGEDDAERDAFLSAMIALDVLNARWIARNEVSL